MISAGNQKHSSNRRILTLVRALDPDLASHTMGFPVRQPGALVDHGGIGFDREKVAAGFSCQRDSLRKGSKRNSFFGNPRRRSSAKFSRFLS